MKNLFLLLITLSVSSCAQNLYRADESYADSGYYGPSERYGRDAYYYANADYDETDDYDGDYDYDRDEGYYREGLSDVDIDFNLNLNWNAFPDRYGIAYGAAINGPYRYPRVGFYYQHNWYPSAWWGSYAAFDPWYSDYYYRHRGSYLSLNFNFYDDDDEWDDLWFDSGWGYALGYNWFRPAYGWNPWRRHHNRWYSAWYNPFYDPWYNPSRRYYHSAHRYSGYRHHGSGNWLVGPHFTPIYRGRYDQDEHGHYSGYRTDHIDTRSEAARLAARSPHYRSSQRSGYRASGRIASNAYHSRSQRHNNPQNVVTRQYKRPHERQRSTRSTHRYDRVPATTQPFSRSTATTIRRNNTQRFEHNQTNSASSRIPHSPSENRQQSGYQRRSSTRPDHRHVTPGTRSAISHKPLYRPQRSLKPSAGKPSRHLQRSARNLPARNTEHRARNSRQPAVRNINRYRNQPTHSPRSQLYRTSRQNLTSKPPHTTPSSSRPALHRPQAKPTTGYRSAPRPVIRQHKAVPSSHRVRATGSSYRQPVHAPRSVPVRPAVTSPTHSPSTAHKTSRNSRSTPRKNSAREHLEKRRHH